ncbi:MAG: hypothetical protein MZV70_38600 [Desulfobacterales bacterium]|nr:hypothetical protein [Desulfobacterales bacterium]
MDQVDGKEEMMSFIQIMTTTETKEQAQAIARHLVDTKAGCLRADHRRY